MGNYVVTLVHGTFSRNAAWTKDDSFLIQKLKSGLPGNIVISRFPWSGHNRFNARISAAADLRAHLEKLISTHPNAEHYVIGHSHGGNVALWAIANTNLCGVVKVICLSTPFLHATQHQHSGLLNFIFRPLHFSLIVTPFFYSSLWKEHESIANAGILILFFLTLSLLSLLDNKFRSSCNHIISAMSYPNYEHDTFFLLRCTNDEAGIFLAAFDLGNWTTDIISSFIRSINGFTNLLLPDISLYMSSQWLTFRRFLFAIFIRFLEYVPIFYLLKYLNNTGSTFSLMFLTPLLTYGVISSMYQFTKSTFSSSPIVIVIDTVSSIIILLVKTIAAILLTIPYGANAFLYGWFMRISVESTPPGVWTIEQIPYIHNQPESLFRVHASYDNHQVIEKLIQWMVKSVKSNDS